MLIFIWTKNDTLPKRPSKWITYNLNNTILQQLREKMSSEALKANDLAEIKGAVIGLTTLPLKSENFDLNKREFYDALSLRYRWTPKYLPFTCISWRQEIRR